MEFSWFRAPFPAALALEPRRHRKLSMGDININLKPCRDIARYCIAVTIINGFFFLDASHIGLVSRANTNTDLKKQTLILILKYYMIVNESGVKEYFKESSFLGIISSSSSWAGTPLSTSSYVSDGEMYVNMSAAILSALWEGICFSGGEIVPVYNMVQP